MAGLNIYRSNRVEVLIEILAGIMAQEPLADPLAPEHIVVGSRGMETWLRRNLSERHGVCANVAFPFPTSLLAKQTAWLAGLIDDPIKTRPSDPWSEDALVWAVLECLPELLESDPAFAPLKEYLRDDDGSIVSRRRYLLAWQIADVFDGYVAYRPQWASAWSRAETPRDLIMPPDGSQSWQPILWRAIQERLGPDQLHLAARAELAHQRLNQNIIPAGGPTRLHLFGVSSLPPAFIEMCSDVSRVIETNLFLLCPSHLYWTDLKSGRELAAQRRHMDRDALSRQLREESPDGHPMLASLGRVARDFQLVLDSLPEAYQDQTEQTRHTADCFIDPITLHEQSAPDTPPSALAVLQSDILHVRHPSALYAERSLQADDNSIQFHACHGATRQVETLRDVLLGLFDDHPDLEPRDILVMTPDIETYAPLISAVFDDGREVSHRDDGWGESGAPRIPFRTADLTVLKLNPLADALLRTVEMASGRIEASTLIDFMSLEPVQRRFGITSDDLPKLQSWISESGIRWGLDSAHRAREGQPEDAANTWRFGLERLALGVTLADDRRLFEGVLPFDAMEGRDTHLLGRLLDLCTTLFEQLEALGKPRSAELWATQLSTTLNVLCEPPHRGYLLLRSITKVLDSLQEHARAAQCDQLMSLEAMATWLKGRFDVPAGGTHNPGGAVTFCAMVPMRSIPHKVICMLGLDDQSFPRQPSTLRFDLAASPRRAGDRDLRDEDRFLFLEALLAARAHLVLLYTGRNIHNGEAEPPATPVGELMDVVDQTFPSVRDLKPSEVLTTDHSLQAFSPNNFHADAPWSYDQRLFRAAQALRQGAEAPPPFFEPSLTLPPLQEQAVVTLDELTRFFSQPVEHLMLRRLEIDLRERVELLSDREPIDLNHLESWQLSSSMLHGADALGLQWPHILECLRAEGRLPLGAAGDRLLDAQRDVVQAGLDCAEWLKQEEARIAPLSIDLNLGLTRLRGTVDPVFGAKSIHLMISKEKPKRFIGPWLALLARTAQDPSVSPESYLVLADKKAQSVFALHSPGDTAENKAVHAKAMLLDLVHLYQQGMAAPLPLFEKSSWTFAKELHGHLLASDFVDGIPEVNDDQQKALAKATQKALTGWHGSERIMGDIDNPHLNRIYAEACPLLLPNESGRETLNHVFAEIALRFWEPILSARSRWRCRDDPRQHRISGPSL